MAKLWKLDGTEIEVHPEDAKKGFTLKELYKLIGCDIVEHVGPGRDGNALIVDEEGWCKERPQINKKATEWYQKQMGGRTAIAGNAILIKDDNSEFK